jgi:hypothetical protein
VRAWFGFQASKRRRPGSALREAEQMSESF